MTSIKNEKRYALYEGERQVTDYIWSFYHDLNYYIILMKDKEMEVYHKETKKFIAKIKGELEWYDEYDNFLVVKDAEKYGVYSFDGNIILPVEFSEIDTNKGYFVVKDVSDLCGIFSLKGENIVPISFENIRDVKFGKDKDSIGAVSVIKEGTRGWYIIKYKRFVPVDEVNITKTDIIEVCVEGKWYILNDTKYLNIVH